MHWIGWIVVVLALVEGGWLLFDGLHAMLTGDYVTPNSGQYAGRLGPWSKLWLAIGVDPRGFFVQSVHVALGALWMVSLVAFVTGAPWAWPAMLACAIAGIWYLPFGTLLSVTQVVLLSLPMLRNGRLASPPCLL